MKVSKNAGRVLGSSEREVMDIMWKHKEMTVREVVSEISVSRKVAYTTIMTVMNRLVEKGILIRESIDSSFIYKPKITKGRFIARAIHSIFSNTVSSLGEEAVVHFMKEIESVDPETRKKLLKLLND